MSNSPQLDIIYLLQEAHLLWGGVMNIFREAQAFQRLGHNCRIICPTELGECYKEFTVSYTQVDSLEAKNLPHADIIIATYFSTIPTAWEAARLGKGRAVHYCQGYEGDSADLFDYLSWIENNYRIPGIQHITINNFLSKRCETLFGWRAPVIPYGIGPEFHQGPGPQTNSSQFRIGLVGPWEIEWKDLPTGLRGVQQASAQGLDITLVRLSPVPIPEDEQKAWGNLKVEAYERLTPQEMGVLYRSMDMFVGSSRGGGEGFFLPALEAMASGVPCLLSDIPCFHSYNKPSDYACFFPAGSSEALAKGIISLGNHPELRQRLRTKGLATAKKYSFDSHMAALEQRLQKVLSKPLKIEDLIYEGWEASRQSLVLEQQGEITRAIDFAKNALKGHPSSFPLWESLGRILGRANRFEEALEALQCASSLVPNSPATLGALAFCQCQLGLSDQAIESYNKALELGLPGPRPHLDLALIHLSKGDSSSAIQALEEAKKRMPRHGPHGKARERIQKEIFYLSTQGKTKCAS